MSKKIICALLAFVLLIGLMPVSAIPASAASDQCGSGLTWSFNPSKSTLTIKGKGAMQDYASADKAPWYKHRKDIKIVDFSHELTAVGKNAFNAADYPNLHAVNIWNIQNWAAVDFRGVNPLSFAHNLWMKGKLIQNLVIPEGTTHIKPRAFQGCSMHSVRIDGNVEYIGREAFADCLNLSSVKLNQNLSFMKEEVFRNCPALTSITIPNGITSFEKGTFKDCKNLSSVTFGTGLRYIGAEAFMGTALSNVVLPEKVETLGAGAFMNCKSLKDIKLTYKLTRLEDNVFNGCSALEKIWIPNSVKYVGANTFKDCENLKGVYMDDLYGWCLIDFEGINPLQYAHKLYEKNKLMKDLVIPNKVTVIKKNTFSGWTELRTVRLPDFLHTINANAFNGCTGIETVFVSSEQRWEELKKNIADAGNSDLKNDKKVRYDRTDGGSGSGDSFDPDKTFNVSENLVNMVAAMAPFSGSAYESPKGSGKYYIGYKTPANKGDTISRNDAKNTLREYLRIAAGQVNAAFGTEVSETQREALAAFSHFNGYSWMNGSNLATVVNDDAVGTILIEAFCGSSVDKSNTALELCLAEADLYLNGNYRAGHPDSYAYVRLNPNGGVSSSYGDVIGYNKAETTVIKSAYAPSRLGYEFLGWYTSANNNSGKLVTALDHTTDAKTIYAHWQKHDEGMSNGEIVGRKVSYLLPAYVGLDKDSTGRIKLYANPEDATHTATVEANAVVTVEREYRHPINGSLWVKVKNSGWMPLGNDKITAVEPGTVKVGPKKRLPVTKTEGSTDPADVVGNLYDGNSVAIFERKTVGKVQYGKTVFQNTEKPGKPYEEGWINLTYVELAGSINGGNVPQETKPQIPADSPNGKAPISKGIVEGTDKLNVRAKPDAGSQKYGILREKTEINIYEIVTRHGVKWALHEKGWSSMEYIREIKDPVPQKPENQKPLDPGDVGSADNKTPLAAGQVIPNVVLSVRKGPGRQYDEECKLTNSARFHIFQTKMVNGAQWGRMEKGWVCMTYVRLDGDITIQRPENEMSKPAEKPATLGQGRVANCSTHVNVRATASARSALQGSYPLNSVIELLEETNRNGHDWYRTTKGWVCGLYVEKIAAPDISTPVTPVVPNPGNPATPNSGTTGTIVCNNTVNVRKGAGIYNEKLMTLRNGSVVNIKGSKVVNGATWYQIDQGWVAGEYVVLGSASVGGNGANSGSGFIGGTTETTNGHYATGTVAQAGTKVRAGAGYGYTEIKTLNLGDKVTIFEHKFLDGVSWARISNNGWINLAFVTLDSTGITGTGTIGTVTRCNHAINVRSAANFESARMATLLLGATVEILETTDKGNGEVWGRTPQGWVNMHYVNMTGPLPTPPLDVPTVDPVNPAPNPNPNPNPTPETEPQKPVDQGIPFPMDGETKAKVNLQMIPGIMGDYDASIEANQKIHITKLEKADGKLYGLVEAGWVDMSQVKIETYAVSEKSQLIWKDASTTYGVGALNKGESVEITELTIDSAKKVWGKIDKGWIELTAISKPESYNKTFMMKGTTKVDALIIRTSPSEKADQVGEKLPNGKLITVIGLQRDIDGALWAQINDGVNTGWVKNENITVNVNGKVIGLPLIGYTDLSCTSAAVVVNQGDELTITEIDLNSEGVPVGKATVDGKTGYFAISGATFVPYA